MADHAGRKAPGERLLKGYTGRLFLGITIGWFAIAFGRQLLPPLLPEIINSLGIASFQAGAALTVLWGMRAIHQYPGGRLADKLSRKTVLVSSLLLLVVGFLLLSGAVNYPLFILGVVVVGAGAGGYTVSVRATTADLFVEKRGRAFGIQAAFNSVASVGAAGGAVGMLVIGTWRSAFLPVAIFLALVAVALHRWSRDPYVIKRIDIGIVKTGHRILGPVPVRRTIAAIVLFVFAWLGMIGFLPTFLQVEKGIAPALASAGFGLVYVVGGGAAPLAGGIADRFGKIPTVGGLILLCGAGLFSLVLADTLVGITLSIVLLATGFRSFLPIAQAHLMDTFSDGTMGGDLGGAKAIYGIVGSMGPTYVGVTAEWWSYTVAYLGLVACLLASLAIILSVWNEN